MASKRPLKPPVPYAYHIDDIELNKRFYQQYQEPKKVIQSQT
jgi:hypothetical protein